MIWVDPVHPADIAILSAFEPELTRLLQYASIQGTHTIDGRQFHVGRLAGNQVVMALTGIGLIQAVRTTETLLEHFNISHVVFSGISGGVNPELNIGDVTVPDRWIQADGDSLWFAADAKMLEIANTVVDSVALTMCTSAGVCLEHEPRVNVGGNGVSNSFFVNDPIYRTFLWESFEAAGVDMETSAIAQVVGAQGIPFIAFRSLSDLAGGGPGQNQVRTFFQLAADNSATLVFSFLDTWAEHEAVVFVDGEASIPGSFILHQNYPNPFNPETNIRYELKRRDRVTLKIVDLRGQLVSTLFEGIETPGMKAISWDGRNASGAQVGSGVYIYTLQAGHAVQSRKMLLIR
jgi:adenosylhomocysteine nucleosidase